MFNNAGGNNLDNSYDFDYDKDEAGNVKDPMEMYNLGTQYNYGPQGMNYPPVADPRLSMGPGVNPRLSMGPGRNSLAFFSSNMTPNNIDANIPNMHQMPSSQMGKKII